MYKKARRQLKFILLLNCSFILVLFYQNCSPMATGNTGSGSGSSSSSSTSSGSDIDTQKAMTILTTKCSSCHDSATKSGGVDVLNINELLARGVVVPNEPSLSVLFTQVQQGQMPPGKSLSQAEIQSLYNWIQSGLNTTPVSPPPVTPPTTLTATFSSIKANILNTRCLSCHSSSNAAKGISFSTYASTMNTVVATDPSKSVLYTFTAIKKTMPPSGGLLTAAQTAVISQWIAAGAPNN
jgi:uncharacterized membrane protein